MLIGALEARESARQIAELSGRVRLTASGTSLTAIGLAASSAVYLALGGIIGRENDALRAGVVVGAIAGLVGGTVRVFLIEGVVNGILDRYPTLPLWFVPLALAAFVVASLAVSTVGGAALTYLGARLGAAIRSEPPRPPA